MNYSDSAIEAFESIYNDVLRYGIHPREASTETILKMKLSLIDLLDLNKIMSNWLDTTYNLNPDLESFEGVGIGQLYLHGHITRLNCAGKTFNLREYIDYKSELNEPINIGVLAFEKSVNDNYLIKENG